MPSAIRASAPAGIRAGIVGENRENVTIPVASMAESRVTDRSGHPEAQSAPLLVAARVVRSTSRISHCIQSAIEAFASITALSVEPTVRSSSCVAQAWTAAAMFAPAC